MFFNHLRKCQWLPWWLSGKKKKKKNLPANAGDSGCILIQEDPTCCGATEPAHHNYSASALEPRNLNARVHAPQLLKPKRSRACALQQEKILQEEAHVSQLESSPNLPP